MMKSPMVRFAGMAISLTAKIVLMRDLISVQDVMKQYLGIIPVMMMMEIHIVTSCYEQEHDDDAPDNPEVYDSDREFIIQISRNWLQGKVEYKKLISINDKDYHLKAIKDKVGLVENPIYIFGLADRDEYQISASPNIIEDVKEVALINGIEAVIKEGIGCNRLGISLSLRQNNLPQIVNLIKQITAVKAKNQFSNKIQGGNQCAAY